jgi:class 3 adenylate cyclase
MAKLTAGERARLPDSAFAYVDSTGKRRLPINDESHVRNALARFEQVKFEDDGAREKARTRLLNAAKRYGIVPVGFITGQFASERKAGARSGTNDLPSGMVTLLFTDIEGSTRLLSQLGKGYEKALSVVRKMIQEAVGEAEGREVEVRADEYFAVFAKVASALDASVTLQRELGAHRWPEGVDVRVRVGIHTGDITMTASGYIGLPVNTAARVCAAGHGGQILVSGEAVNTAKGSTPDGIAFRSLGSHELRGLPEVTEIYQIEAAGLLTRFPTLRLSGE